MAVLDRSPFALEIQRLNSQAVLEATALVLDHPDPMFVERVSVDRQQALQVLSAQANAMQLIVLRSANRLEGHPLRVPDSVCAAAVAPINRLQHKVPQHHQGSR